jgi:single-strand DNA-binding protein
MMGLNKVQLIGHLGRDPESRTLQSGGTVVTLSVATSEPWIDRDSGERRDKTEWHRVAIFSDGLGEITTRYLRKGSKVYVEGRLQTRKWQDQSGAERHSTEIVLPPYAGKLIFLDPREREDRENDASRSSRRTPAANTDTADDIPF